MKGDPWTVEVLSVSSRVSSFVLVYGLYMLRRENGLQTDITPSIHYFALHLHTCL